MPAAAVLDLPVLEGVLNDSLIASAAGTRPHNRGRIAVKALAALLVFMLLSLSLLYLAFSMAEATQKQVVSAKI